MLSVDAREIYSLKNSDLIKFFMQTIFQLVKSDEQWLSDREKLNKAHACMLESFLLLVNSLPPRKYLHGTLAIEFRYLYPLCLLQYQRRALFPWIIFLRFMLPQGSGKVSSPCYFSPKQLSAFEFLEIQCIQLATWMFSH